MFIQKENDFQPLGSLLPYEGCVEYYGKVFDEQAASLFFEKLLSNIDWKQDKAIIFGKTIYTQRKVAWYAERPFSYTYSRTTKHALPWTAELLEIKTVVEQLTGERFNSCLLNLYHSGNEGMAWHSDGETELKKGGAIASVSFGAVRKFCFKHKQSKEKVDVILEHGSLLVMKENTQTHWLHRLPPAKKIETARINLTFRIMTENGQ